MKRPALSGDESDEVVVFVNSAHAENERLRAALQKIEAGDRREYGTNSEDSGWRYGPWGEIASAALNVQQKAGK